jgi:cell wall-associated NlpC family hydrolase
LTVFLLRASALLVFAFLCLPNAAQAQSPTGGSQYAPPPPPVEAPPTPADLTVPGVTAQLLPDGTAAAPADAPAPVQQAVWAANRIQDKPYKYGGGHAKIEDTGYDCSGTVSYALHHAGLLETPLDSGSFMSWGAKGRGAWITVFTNPGHAYAVIAGLRLDTSSYGVSTASRKFARSALERGPRWRPTARPPRGFRARHPLGL